MWAEEPGIAGSAAPSSSMPHADEQNLIDVPIGQVTLPRQPPAEEGHQEAQSLRCDMRGFDVHENLLCPSQHAC